MDGRVGSRATFAANGPTIGADLESILISPKVSDKKLFVIHLPHYRMANGFLLCHLASVLTLVRSRRQRVFRLCRVGAILVVVRSFLSCTCLIDFRCKCLRVYI